MNDSEERTIAIATRIVDGTLIVLFSAVCWLISDVAWCYVTGF